MPLPVGLLLLQPDLDRLLGGGGDPDGFLPGLVAGGGGLDVVVAAEEEQ